MKRFARVLMLLLLLSPALFAAEDLTGKWSGTHVLIVGGKPITNTTVVLVLTQTGTTLTGTAGPNENSQSGTVKGTVKTVKKDGKDVTNVTLDVADDGDDRGLRFALTLIDGNLKGKAEGDMAGRKITAVLDLTRLKK